MTKKEQTERKRLHKLWAIQRATLKQMRRCMELDRKFVAGAERAMRSPNP